MFNFLSPKIQAFGIDLSDLSIKIASLKKKSGKISLVSFGRQEIETGLIEDGEIKKENDLIKLIKKVIQEIKGKRLKTKYCIVSLPETFSFVQVVRLPQMKKEEVAEAIKWELEAHIPMAKNEVYYDWQILPSLNYQDHLDILLGVLPKKTVDPYLEVLKKSGLKPLAFEIESIATARSLIKTGFSEDPVLLIDLGAKRTSLLIFACHSLYFTTSLPISNNLLIESLSQKLNISREKAKQIKFKVGMNLKHPQSRVFLEFKAPLLEIIEKIKNYMDFYNGHIMAQTKNKKITRIVLCGGGAMMKDLPEYLAQELKMPVEIGNPWTNISENPGDETFSLPASESLSYTTALGLALRGLEP